MTVWLPLANDVSHLYCIDAAVGRRAPAVFLTPYKDLPRPRTLLQCTSVKGPLQGPSLLLVNPSSFWSLSWSRQFFKKWQLPGGQLTLPYARSSNVMAVNSGARAWPPLDQWASNKRWPPWLNKGGDWIDITVVPLLPKSRLNNSQWGDLCTAMNCFCYFYRICGWIVGA